MSTRGAPKSTRCEIDVDGSGKGCRHRNREQRNAQRHDRIDLVQLLMSGASLRSAHRPEASARKPVELLNSAGTAVELGRDRDAARLRQLDETAQLAESFSSAPLLGSGVRRIFLGRGGPTTDLGKL